MTFLCKQDAKGGFVVYMDEESELLTLPLSHNCLEIVFRDTGCMSFVKVSVALD